MAEFQYVTPDTLKEIGRLLEEGLTDEEACLIVGIPLESLKLFMEQEPKASNFIQKKRLEFKRAHLQVINEKRDPKSSMWLLERLMPEQFANKRASDVNPTNVLAVFLKEVQNQPTQYLIKESESEGHVDINTKDQAAITDFIK